MFNNVLLKIEKLRVKVVAYADDVSILSSGQFTTTISERVGKALKILNECGLGINPDKTELILLTGKRKIPSFITPKLGDKHLELSAQANYL